MTTNFVGKENDQVKFTMEFTADEFEAAIQSAYLRNRSRINVDGFRKGKAPRKIIEARYGSEVFFEEALESLVNENYSKALDEVDIYPIDRPAIDFDEDQKLEHGKGFRMLVTAPVAPEPEVKDYMGIQAERELQVYDPNLVDEQLKSMQKRNARLINTEEPANWDDTVVIDYKGFIGDEQFEGGTADDHSLLLGSNTFIPGFEAQLVGCKAGEEKDVVVTFPQEYHAENLAGKEAVFKCTVKEVKTEELPELDDEFAKDVSEFDTLDELRADIEKKGREQVDSYNETTGKDAVLQKLCELNPVEIPEVMVKDEADGMFNEFAQQMAQQGIDINMYCHYVGTTPEELRKTYDENARKRVHSRLLVEAVAKAENIEVTDEDVENELQKLADQYSMEIDKLRDFYKDATLKMLQRDIRLNKAVDLIYKNAVLTEPVKEEKLADENAEAAEEQPAAEKTEE